MYRFHVAVRPQPVAVPGGPESLDGQILRPLRVTPPMLHTAFPLSFEQASTDLAALPRMFIEPDGSLVWVGDQTQGNWQIDGVLYDRSERLLYVELKGQCPENEFDRLLRALGWPATPLMFQLIRKAVYLTEADFRLWADDARPLT